MTTEEGVALQAGDPIWVWHGYEWLAGSVRGLRFGRILHVDILIETEVPLSGKFRKKTPSQIERRNLGLNGADRPRHAGRVRRVANLALSRRRDDSAGSATLDN
ncbi:MAG TPA: hypothetical protein VMA09_07815 [Candidatus Binataceae bacterium]|nr:hypothetical protein [Candidatus Binataceae bacterium]